MAGECDKKIFGPTCAQTLYRTTSLAIPPEPTEN